MSMKKLILTILAASLTLLVACEKEPEIKNPDINIQVVESDDVSVTFKITTQNVDLSSILFQSVDDAVPTMAQVINEGESFKSSLDTLLVYDNLQSSSIYRLNVVAINSEYHIMESSEAETSVSYDMDLNMTNATGWYYGDFQKTGNGYYMLAFGDSNAELTDTGLPTKVGQKVIHIYLGGEKSKDSHNAIIPTGRYILSDAYGNTSVNLYNSRYMECTSISEEKGIEGLQYNFFDGFVDVESKGDNNYKIVIDMFVNDESKTHIRSTYEGTLSLINNDPASYNPVKEDKLNIKMINGSGNYIPDKNYGMYTLVIYNVSTTPDGFINGAGDLINVTFMPEPARPMDIEKATGTYTIVSASSPDALAPGNALSGEYIESYGQYIPIGTFYQLYDENAVVKELGLAKEGTIKVEYKDSKVNLNIEFVTIEGAKISSKCTIDQANIFDYSDYFPASMSNLFIEKMINVRDVNKPFYMIF